MASERVWFLVLADLPPGLIKDHTFETTHIGNLPNRKTGVQLIVKIGWLGNFAEITFWRNGWKPTFECWHVVCEVIFPEQGARYLAWIKSSGQFTNFTIVRRMDGKKGRVEPTRKRIRGCWKWSRWGPRGTSHRSSFKFNTFCGEI